MSKKNPNPYVVAADGSFRVADAPTGPPDGVAGKKESKQRLEKVREKLSDLQRKLY